MHTIALVIAMIPLLAHPAVEIEEYRVIGLTRAELLASLDANGPEAHSMRWDARTTWRVGWDWPGHGTSACRFDQARITLHIRVPLPSWEPPAGADLDLVRAWQAYVLALAWHEAGHVALAVCARHDVEQALSEATCETAEEAAQAVIRETIAKEQEYERLSGHGAYHGARRP